MKIRSLYLHNFRSFREPTTISFCDELTGEPRLITALAGTNGAGKTTVLEAIEALLAYALDPDHPPALVREWCSDRHRRGRGHPVCLSDTCAAGASTRDAPLRHPSERYSGYNPPGARVRGSGGRWEHGDRD